MTSDIQGRIAQSIPTEGVSPEAAASAYERELESFYRAECLDPARSLFDVTLPGLRPDGHTASLFPNTAVLAERDRWVAAVVASSNADARLAIQMFCYSVRKQVAAMIAALACPDRPLPTCSAVFFIVAAHCAMRGFVNRRRRCFT
jgi:hypothetical protein